MYVCMYDINTGPLQSPSDERINQWSHGWHEVVVSNPTWANFLYAIKKP